ncbi:amidohydrolase family protein [Brevibacterium sp.]|uniref:metal-dependent hydrolase family protein n=1 Tax=Brevibacterium sp. TaxID=1701 RepID=UPI0025C6571A|nr:amidohydrolase family protein [Brevibacterium sp.]
MRQGDSTHPRAFGPRPGRGWNAVLRNGRFLDPETGLVVEGDMRIENGEIAEIGEIGAVARTGASPEDGPGGYVETDLGGTTVTPGLIDAHFHAYAAGMGGIMMATRTTSFVVINGVNRLSAALRRGFTTVRDVAGGDIGLQQAIERGMVDAPHYLFSGRVLSQTGGHGDVRPAEHDLHAGCDHTHEVVDGIDALRTAVRERLRTGSHVIKIMASGGVISPTDPLTVPQYSAEEIAVVCEEAGRRGRYVAAHAYSAEAVIHAVTNGVRSVEHGNLIDAEAARVIADNGAFLVPTLAAYDAMRRRGEEAGLSPVGREKNAEVLGAGQQAIRLAREAGVRVGFGTDLMGDLEDEQLRGIELQAQVLEPLELLRSMTVENAALIQDPGRGNLAVGSAADLVAFREDPLEDVSVLWDQTRPRVVIQGGAVVWDER